MKKSVVKIAIGVYLSGLFLVVFFNLSVPPADLPIYLGLAAIALIPTMFGENRHRTFGGIFILICLILAGFEHFAGLKGNKLRQRLHQIEENNSETNTPASQKS